MSVDQVQEPEMAGNHRRMSALQGVPVVILVDGSKHGAVEHVFFGSVGRRLIGMTVRGSGGFLSRGELFLLRADQIHSIGRDAVTVERAASLQGNSNAERDLAAEAGESTVGKSVMTSNGKAIGAVQDIIFDSETGAVFAYEVSGGVWQNLTHGRSRITVPNVVSIGPDVMVVKDIV